MIAVNSLWKLNEYFLKKEVLMKSFLFNLNKGVFQFYGSSILVSIVFLTRYFIFPLRLFQPIIIDSFSRKERCRKDMEMLEIEPLYSFYVLNTQKPH